MKDERLKGVWAGSGASGRTARDEVAARLKRRAKRKLAAREKREVYESLGMVRVRGNLGGTYYE